MYILRTNPLDPTTAAQFSVLPACDHIINLSYRLEECLAVQQVLPRQLECDQDGCTEESGANVLRGPHPNPDQNKEQRKNIGVGKDNIQKW
jgi:hypothetical protein